eukprot:7753449-Pyramimonas_sp.AAC.1
MKATIAKRPFASSEFKARFLASGSCSPSAYGTPSRPTFSKSPGARLPSCLRRPTSHRRTEGAGLPHGRRAGGIVGQLGLAGGASQTFVNKGVPEDNAV